MFIAKVKEKVFYYNGYLILNYLIDSDSKASSSRTTEAVFYSDNIESKIFEIDEILNNKNGNNKELDSLLACIRKGTKRHGYQSQANAYIKCIQEF